MINRSSRPSDQKLSVLHVEIGKLRPDPGSSRRFSDPELASLTRSIQQFGFVDPVIVRHEENTVIGGQKRLLAARRLGFKWSRSFSRTSLERKPGR